jgi:predicted signal transduction protein with EAL and GGDEF domain
LVYYSPSTISELGSSWSYLKRLPPDVLKIDRSFVSGIGHNQEDTAIVPAIMAMAKSLDFKGTSEGIVTAEQAAILGEWATAAKAIYVANRSIATERLRYLNRQYIRLVK